MKNIILLTGVLFSTSVLACANKVDPSKVILFVDTNNSELEIGTAQKAACARGETLKVVPKNYLEYGAYSRKMEAVAKKIQAAKCTDNSAPGCAELYKAYEKSYTDLNDFRQKQKSTAIQVKEALEEVKKGKGKLQHVAISGHDGGGHFSGNKGSFGRTELAAMMTDYADINDVKSLLLLGCYTGTQHEVMAWKTIFPQTKLIGGYDGSAPLADRPQGHQYIMDILLKEKQLVKQADEKKLQSYVDANIKGLTNLNAGMYVQCSDGTSEQNYYYGSKKQRKFEKVQLDECINKAPELREVASSYQKYLSGELAVPADTQGGALRQLYNKARTYEHCGDITGVFIDVNGIFNLLFYEGVKQSFANFYKDDLTEVEKYLNLDPAELEQNLVENQKPALEYMAKLEAEIAKMNNSPEEYIREKQAEIEKAKENFTTLLNKKENEDLKRFFDPQTGMLNFDNQPLTQEIFKRLEPISQAATVYAMQKQSLDFEKSNLKQASLSRTQMLDGIKANLESQKVAMKTLKAELQDPKNKIWVPNAENLKKYSREDLLKNIHRMNTAMSVGALKKEQHLAVSWLAGATSAHLQNFRNPFEWHEFQGQAKKPDQTASLKDVLSGKSYGFPGTMPIFNGQIGGYGSGPYGGMYGGGFGGGFGGGYGGGLVGGSAGGGATSGSSMGTMNGGFGL